MPGHTDPKLVEEIRRTLVVLGVSKETTAQEVMQYFGNGAGEVTTYYPLVFPFSSLVDAIDMIF